MDLVCQTCRSQPPLCDHCVAQQLSWFTGAASLRGHRWAERVRAQLGSAAPATWPPFDGRCEAIARRLASGLSDDDRVNDRLARECWVTAKKVYEGLTLEQAEPFRLERGIGR